MRRRVLACLAALLLGGLAGRLSAPLPDPSTADPHTGPTSERAGVGGGYAHTRAGAILASAGYQRAFADAAVLHPGELRRRVEAVATPGFAEVMLAANSPGAARLWRGAFGTGLRRGVKSLYLGFPLAYRMLSYSPGRALIRSWGFTAIGNASPLEPAAYFGTSKMELTWTEGEWRIADAQGSFGPTPRLASPRHGGEGFGLIDLLGELRPYGIAP